MTSNNDNPAVAGAGPWSFAPDDPLDPGEPWRLDFRNMRYRDQPRYFSRFIPLDDVVVTNRDTAAVLDVTYNDRFPSVVEPKQTRSFDSAGVVSVEVVNRSSNPNPVDPSSLTVEVSTEGVTADSQARRQAEQNPLGRVVEHFTGVDPVSDLRGRF